ncbi:MAG: Fe-S oxidoreductase, partial [Clostridiales bacterium]|nr:Fe-S oxidoreductase [Clostridiales bacterium]
MKKLGFGLMRMPLTDPTDDAKVDVEQVKRMVDLFMAKGFTYFDTAIMYNGFTSQRVAREAIVDRYPRDRFTLATKLHNAFFNSRADMERIFSEQLEQTGAGYFDYYLLHGVEAGSYVKYERFDC